MGDSRIERVVQDLLGAPSPRRTRIGPTTDAGVNSMKIVFIYLTQPFFLGIYLWVQESGQSNECILIPNAYMP